MQEKSMNCEEKNWNHFLIFVTLEKKQASIYDTKPTSPTSTF